MDVKLILIGIVIALLVGTGIGYTIKPNEPSNQEEYENNLTLLKNTNLELQNKNVELQTVLASTELEKIELQETLKTNIELFETIEEKLDMFESGFGSPVFDSGWTAIDPGETISMEHELGTVENSFVYVIGRYYEGQINQLYYGLGYLSGVEIGNGWTMDDTHISVTRGVADVHWIEIRVYIWKIYPIESISVDTPTTYYAMGTIDSYVNVSSAEIMPGHWFVKIEDDELLYKATYYELNFDEKVEESPVGSVDIFTHTLSTSSFDIKNYAGSSNHVLTFSGMVQIRKVWVKPDWTREIVTREYEVNITITPYSFYLDWDPEDQSTSYQDWDRVGTTLVIQS